MHGHILLDLCLVLTLGVASQWIAWRFRLPSIVLLLCFGFIIGPLTGYLHPDKLLGHLLLPFVSFSVAIILFEGGLSLKFSEVRESGAVVWKLVTVGALVTWFLGSLAAHYIIGIDWAQSILLASILVVSGPTVIGPLLLHVRPSGKVSSILKWEGILIDPIGALFAVLLFEIVLEGTYQHAPWSILQGLSKTILLGSFIGYTSASILILFLKKYWIPDYLINPFSFMMVFITFAISDYFQPESGLAAVTVMGIALANTKTISIHPLVEFKEDLRVLLLSFLFILLVAQLSWEHISHYGFSTILFLLALLFIIRPLSVIASTVGSNIKWNERLFMSWMAPRGIVAAAVASVFSLQLQAEGLDEAGSLVALTFAVIIGTVIVYGFTAAPVARLLNVAQPHPNGFLFIGGYSFARKLAKRLQDEGFHVLIADTNRRQVHEARMQGIPAYFGNILSEYVLLGGIGRVFALTSNDEMNALASVHFTSIMGQSDVFQIAPSEDGPMDTNSYPKNLQGRHLFGPDVSLRLLLRRMNEGYDLKKTKLTDTFTYDKFHQFYQEKDIPLLILDENGKIHVINRETKYTPKAGDQLFALVPPDNNKSENNTKSKTKS